ncbi:hypothetical protein OIU80_19735 [Flavobacterium sp. LS1R47]|uniref:Uncharacterized protein n=1 Tax=Flavobacterium frigoritolerans TaxID=2987686 RepID=A0A9X3CAD9_9FLAO|nr:hypothetical protein [Flavobacterium frigoritolerans]MCV9934518.1 hypothetical protein [Flavobacterium frigoritolerans]
MIGNKIPKRLEELELVLKYDTECTPILKVHERFAINQERAKLFANDFSYSQSEIVETKIKMALSEIRKNDWHPLNT